MDRDSSNHDITQKKYSDTTVNPE